MESIEKKYENLSELDKEILLTTLNMFKEKGYHNTVVDDIAREVGVGKGTIYRHFGNKEMLFASGAYFIFRNAYEHIPVANENTTIEDGVKDFIAFQKDFMQGWGHYIFTTLHREVNLHAKFGPHKKGSELFMGVALELRLKTIEYFRIVIENEQRKGNADPNLNAAVASEFILMIWMEANKLFNDSKQFKKFQNSPLVELGRKKSYEQFNLFVRNALGMRSA